MPYLKRINSLPLINHISYKYAQVSDIGPSWSSCLSCNGSIFLANEKRFIYLVVKELRLENQVNLARACRFFYSMISNGQFRAVQNEEFFTCVQYSITCIQRTLKGSNESGLLQQVVFKCRFY